MIHSCINKIAELEFEVTVFIRQTSVKMDRIMPVFSIYLSKVGVQEETLEVDISCSRGKILSRRVEMAIVVTNYAIQVEACIDLITVNFFTFCPNNCWRINTKGMRALAEDHGSGKEVIPTRDWGRWDDFSCGFYCGCYCVVLQLGAWSQFRHMGPLVFTETCAAQLLKCNPPHPVVRWLSISRVRQFITLGSTERS